MLIEKADFLNTTQEEQEKVLENIRAKIADRRYVSLELSLSQAIVDIASSNSLCVSIFSHQRADGKVYSSGLRLPDEKWPSGTISTVTSF